MTKNPNMYEKFENAAKFVGDNYQGMLVVLNYTSVKGKRYIVRLEEIVTSPHSEIVTYDTLECSIGKFSRKQKRHLNVSPCLVLEKPNPYEALLFGYISGLCDEIGTNTYFTNEKYCFLKVKTDMYCVIGKYDYEKLRLDDWIKPILKFLPRKVNIVTSVGSGTLEITD